MLSFESFTGGLIAPETDPDNPWGYKFTWNPRNVVMAGQGTAKFLQKGHFKYIPYGQLFKRITPVNVSGHSRFEGYLNRDSLKYIDTYNLQGIQTMVRGTLRNPGFCAAWDVLVQLGCTDDSYAMEGVDQLTHRDFINAFLDLDPHKNIEENLCRQMNLDMHGEEMARLKWSGFFEKELIGLENGTSARILEHILNKKWKLSPSDKDLVVMWHRFIFENGGKQGEIQSSLVITGEDSTRTAMARTVGLPMALATKLLVQNRISARGVVIPVTREFYDPILFGLKEMGVEFKVQGTRFKV
jgi:saccharopine dehydrogenase (NADP+, L-glutamate forming)